MINLFEGVTGYGIKKIAIKIEKDKEQKKNDPLVKDFPLYPVLFGKLSHYITILRQFQAIEDINSPMNKLIILQTGQVVNNCWAKRTQATQLLAFDRPLYKKFRLALLQKQRTVLTKGLQKFLKEPDKLPLDSQGMMTYEKVTLYSQYLCDLKDLPTPEYFKALYASHPQALDAYASCYHQVKGVAPVGDQLFDFAAFEASKMMLEVLDHNIAKLQARRIYLSFDAKASVPTADNKETDHITPQEIKKACVVTHYDKETRSKKYGVRLFIDGKEKELKPATFLTLVAKNEIIDPEVLRMVQFLDLKLKKKYCGNEIFYPPEESLTSPRP